MATIRAAFCRKLLISILAQSNGSHLSHTAPLCPLLPQLLLNALAMPDSEGQPHQGFAQKSVEIQDTQSTREHSMVIYIFLPSVFSAGTGSKLLMSFPPTRDSNFSPWTLGHLRCIALPQPLPLLPISKFNGMGESRCQAAPLPGTLSRCVWQCDVTESGRDITHR